MDCPKQPCPSTFTAHFLVAMQRLKRPPRRSASRGNCQSSLLLIWGVAILSLVVLNLTVHLPVPRYNPGVDEAPDAACEVKNKMCTCLFGKSKSWAREVDAADDNSVINLDQWAIVKDREVAKKMIKFIELNTIGVSKDSQLRAAKILKVITDGCEFPKVGDVDTFFDYGRRLMAERWERLREAVKKTGIFSLPDFPVETCNFTRTSASTYPAFAWLKCEKEGIEDCQSFLKKYNILTRNGKQFGEKPTYTRVSMLDHDETFDLLIKRLYSMA